MITEDQGSGVSEVNQQNQSQKDEYCSPNQCDVVSPEHEEAIRNEE